MTMRSKFVASEKPGGLPIPYRAESIDAFLDVLQRRRSIRTGFLRDKPVPDELIEKILEAARWAPSAGNSQPWEFLVIRNPEIREKIVEIFKTQMRDKIEIEEATRGQRRRVNAGVDFRHAPVHVLVLTAIRARTTLTPCAQSWTSGKRIITAAWRIASCRCCWPPRCWGSAPCTSAM